MPKVQLYLESNMGQTANTEHVAVACISETSRQCETEAYELSENHGEALHESNNVRSDASKEALFVLLGCSCTGFAGLALINCPGSLQAWISEHELSTESVARLGWIFGFYAFMSFFAGIQIGPIFDAYGPRGLILVGSTLMLATYLILGICHTYWQFFLTLGVLGGIGTSILITCAVGTVQLWYVKRRGIATAVALCGGSLSGITFPIILQKLLPDIGFAWTLRAFALLISPFLIVGCFLTRRRRPVRSQKPSMRRLIFDPRILLTPDMLLITLGVFTLEFGLFVVISYISSYALQERINFGLSYHTLSIINAGSLVGRLVSGHVGDVIGRYNTQIIATLLCALSILIVWLNSGNSTGLLILFTILFGFGSGSTLSLVPVCVGQLCDVERYGRTYTAVYTVSSIG